MNRGEHEQALFRTARPKWPGRRMNIRRLSGVAWDVARVDALWETP